MEYIDYVIWGGLKVDLQNLTLVLWKGSTDRVSEAGRSFIEEASQEQLSGRGYGEGSDAPGSKGPCVRWSALT